MKDTGHLPPERRLPSRRRDQILRSVLNGEEPTMSKQSRAVRWATPIAVAAAAALVAVGAVALTGGDGGGTPSASQPADNNTVPLDLGPLTEAEVKAEVGVDDLDDYTLRYTRRVDGPQQPIPVVVVTVPDGQRDYFNVGKVADIHQRTEPTPADPIQVPEPGFSTPEGGDAVYGETPAFWKIAGVYRVADTVDRIEVRVGTSDGPEPWRVSPAHGGYVFWATWFKAAEYEPGTELTLEWRAYDTDGNAIDPELLPDQPRTVTVP